MKKNIMIWGICLPLRGFLLFMLIACFTCTSYASTAELMELIESKDFWLTYKWGKLEDSEIYKIKALKPHKLDNGDEVDFVIWLEDRSGRNSNISGHMIVNNDSRTDYISSYEINFSNMYYVYYDHLVNWAEKQFGDTHIDYELTIFKDNKFITEKQMSWILNDTVAVTSINYITNAGSTDTKSFRLVFYDKSLYKIMKPTTSFICKTGIDTNIVKDVIQFTIDENINKIISSSIVRTSFDLSVTDNMFTIAGVENNHYITFKMDRINGNLEGYYTKVGSPDNTDKTTMTGTCQKIDSSTKRRPYNKR